MLKTNLIGLAKMILLAAAGGAVNILAYYAIFANINEATKADETALNNYGNIAFVFWVLFSAWFLAGADTEWKECAKAVRAGDKETFHLEAPKRIAPSIRVLYLFVSLVALASFHMFHLSSTLVKLEMHFGLGFLVILAIQVLWDLDDPVKGIINIPNIPPEWLEELEKKKLA